MGVLNWIQKRRMNKLFKDPAFNSIYKHYPNAEVIGSTRLCYKIRVMNKNTWLKKEDIVFPTKCCSGLYLRKKEILKKGLL